MNKKLKLIIVFILFVGVLGGLIYTSISKASTFYMTVDELKDNQQEVVGKPLKLSGKIVGDSVQFNTDKIQLTFEIRGEDDSSYRVPIEFNGVKPDSLNDGWEAIVEGELSEDGTFMATEVLVKCPSKYEAMEEGGVEVPETMPINSNQPKKGDE